MLLVLVFISYLMVFGIPRNLTEISQLVTMSQQRLRAKLSSNRMQDLSPGSAPISACGVWGWVVVCRIRRCQ